MSGRPDFMDSPYFVDETFNWHLKPGAPPEVVEEFESFMLEDDNLTLTEGEQEQK